eukprot:7244684-Pyramimonas_sp.AAC.1
MSSHVAFRDDAIVFVFMLGRTDRQGSVTSPDAPPSAAAPRPSTSCLKLMQPFPIRAHSISL